MHQELGKRVGRFVLGDELGRGGFGTVYRAEDADGGRIVAVKMVPAPDAEQRQRVAKELQVTADLDSPHVLPVLDVVQENSDLCLVYPYVEGESVDRLLRGGGLVLRDSLAVARAAARGLAAAHARGIVHRDVKPSNILVPRAGAGFAYDRAIVMDFGVLGELSGATGKTQAGMVVGTPAYMSPEQLSGTSQSPATDVYGLAAVMFEMLYKRRLHRAENLFALMQDVMRGESEVPDDPEVPVPLRALLARALSRSMADRPRDAAEFLAELDRIALGPSDGTAGLEAESVPDGSRRAPGDGAVTAPSRQVSSGPVAGAGRGESGAMVWTIAGSALASGAAGFVLLASPWSWLALGVGLCVAGVAGGLATHRHLAAQESDVSRRAANLLSGAESRDSLTQSLAIRLDQLWEQCRSGEQEIVWHTVAMMVREYQDARDSDDRQSALMNLIALVGELQRRLSPWHVRHEKAVSFGVGVVGIASGVASTVIAIAKALA